MPIVLTHHSRTCCLTSPGCHGSRSAATLVEMLMVITVIMIALGLGSAGLMRLIRNASIDTPSNTTSVVHEALSRAAKAGGGSTVYGYSMQFKTPTGTGWGAGVTTTSEITPFTYYHNADGSPAYEKNFFRLSSGVTGYVPSYFDSESDSDATPSIFHLDASGAKTWITDYANLVALIPGGLIPVQSTVGKVIKPTPPGTTATDNDPWPYSYDLSGTEAIGSPIYVVTSLQTDAPLGTTTLRVLSLLGAKVPSTIASFTVWVNNEKLTATTVNTATNDVTVSSATAIKHLAGSPVTIQLNVPTTHYIHVVFEPGSGSPRLIYTGSTATFRTDTDYTTTSFTTGYDPPDYTSLKKLKTSYPNQFEFTLYNTTTKRAIRQLVMLQNGQYASRTLR